MPWIVDFSWICTYQSKNGSKSDPRALDYHLNFLILKENIKKNLFQTYYTEFQDLPFPTEGAKNKPATLPAIQDRKKNLFPDHHGRGVDVIDGLKRWIDSDFCVKANTAGFLGLNNENLSETAQSKHIETNNLFLMFSNKYMQKMLENNPKTLMFDTTHKVRNNAILNNEI